MALYNHQPAIWPEKKRKKCWQLFFVQSIKKRARERGWGWWGGRHFWPQLINRTLFRLACTHYLFTGAFSQSEGNMFQHLVGGGAVGGKKRDDGGKRERRGGMNSCQVSVVAMAFHQPTPLWLNGLIGDWMPKGGRFHCGESGSKVGSNQSAPTHPSHPTGMHRMRARLRDVWLAGTVCSKALIAGFLG